MKWLEIIELRSAEANAEKIKGELTVLVLELNREMGKHGVRLYAHSSVNTDFSIHIVHNVSEVQSTGSDLGVQIATGLKEYGLVNHKIWIQTNTRVKQEINHEPINK